MQTCTKLLLFLTRGSIALKCLVFFFCTFFAGLDNRLLVPKKKIVTHFPKDLTPQAYSQMSMKESLLSVGHLDTVSHQRNVEVFVETVSSPE